MNRNAARVVGCALLLSVILGVELHAQEVSGNLFPFVMPWNDGSATAVSLRGWNSTGGELARVVVGSDGHLHAGGKRIRFLGVNLCFGACFPDKEAAPQIAARLAKFGINVVRFHHMDGGRYPRGIIHRQGRDTRRLDPEALDRLAYFIRCLKQEGIYVNLNLLVSRRFNAADGLPASIEELDWKDRHLVGFFFEPLIELQAEYARALLMHRNPHTGLRFADDPVVAFVEINNENGLVHGWLGGRLDSIPEPFASVLARQWNDWLSRRYTSTQELVRAWQVRREPPGPNLTPDGSFERGLAGWRLERHDGAAAQARVVSVEDGAIASRHAAQIVVERAGEEPWHVQFNRPGLRVEGGVPYTLEFYARADRPRVISVGVRQAHAPWNHLGFRRRIQLTKNWQRFEFTFMLHSGDENARIDFSSLSQAGATFWIAGVKFYRGGVVGLAPGASLEKRNISVVSYQRRDEATVEKQRDWVEFLYETERRYWQRMRRVIKEEIGARALVTGTIVGCSTPHLMAEFDWVDTHAYWQHPVFPGRPWDPENWYVRNLTMVNEAGGTIPRLALRRVRGKPHAVTEYNHPFPNTYSVEAFPLLAAYAAFQDWDAIYAFSYCHRTNDWDARRISGFFDIDQHPVKMATLPVAAALFRRGDVRPGVTPVYVPLSRQEELRRLVGARAWQLVDASTVGLNPTSVLEHRVALELTEAAEGTSVPQHDVQEPFLSDTGQLRWERTGGKGVVTVVTPETRIAVGFLRGKSLDLGGVVVRDVKSLQSGWACVALVPLRGTLERGETLVVLGGYAMNTNMRWLVDPWKNPLRATVGRHWGTAPSLVEGVEATIDLPRGVQNVRCFELDPTGAPAGEVFARRLTDGRMSVRVGTGKRTIWYLIDCR